jgi:hypothetical protein
MAEQPYFNTSINVRHGNRETSFIAQHLFLRGKEYQRTRIFSSFKIFEIQPHNLSLNNPACRSKVTKMGRRISCGAILITF